MNINNPKMVVDPDKPKIEGCAPFVLLGGLAIIAALVFFFSWPEHNQNVSQKTTDPAVSQIPKGSGAEGVLAQNNTSSQNQAALTQSYANTVFGYTVKYPADWVYEYQSDGNLTFSGKDGTPAYDSTINIGRIDGDNLNNVVDNLKKSYTGDANAKAQIENEKDYSYTMPDGSSVTGKSFEVSYTDTTDSTAYRDMLVIIPKGNQYYIWNYSSPAGQYDTYNNINQAMLGSWVIGK